MLLSVNLETGLASQMQILELKEKIKGQKDYVYLWIIFTPIGCSNESASGWTATGSLYLPSVVRRFMLPE
jgi:hypothetical protein